METISIWHWLIVILFIVIFAIPVARILQRAGYSRWWTVLWFVPLFNVVGLWAFAFSRWPTVGGGSNLESVPLTNGYNNDLNSSQITPAGNGMVARLGQALHWAAAGIAVLLIVIGGWLNLNDASQPSWEGFGFTVLAGLIVWLFGRACLYVLSGR